KQLVEEGFEAVLSRKPRAMPAVARIFDGEKEAKLIALACFKPPKGRARWTLRLLENKVVELGIVDRASDSTIGRALKKTLFSPDRENHRLQLFDGNGKYETQWNNLHRPCGLFMPPGKCPVCYIGELGAVQPVSRNVPNLGPRVTIVDNTGEAHFPTRRAWPDLAVDHVRHRHPGGLWRLIDFLHYLLDRIARPRVDLQLPSI